MLLINSIMLRIWRTSPTPERIVTYGHPIPSRQISALMASFTARYGAYILHATSGGLRGKNLLIWQHYPEYAIWRLSVVYRQISTHCQNAFQYIACQWIIGDLGFFTGQQWLILNRFNNWLFTLVIDDQVHYILDFPASTSPPLRRKTYLFTANLRWIDRWNIWYL